MMTSAFSSSASLTISSLDHASIVPVYSVGSERGVHYYAMQLIQGQSMAEVIEDLKQFADGEELGSSRQSSPPSELAKDMSQGRFLPSEEGSSVYDATMDYSPGLIGVVATTVDVRLLNRTLGPTR